MEDVDANKMTDVDPYTEMHVDPGEAGRSSTSNRRVVGTTTNLCWTVEVECEKMRGPEVDERRR